MNNTSFETKLRAWNWRATLTNRVQTASNCLSFQVRFQKASPAHLETQKGEAEVIHVLLHKYTLKILYISSFKKDLQQGDMVYLFILASPHEVQTTEKSDRNIRLIRFTEFSQTREKTEEKKIAFQTAHKHFLDELWARIDCFAMEKRNFQGSSVKVSSSGWGSFEENICGFKLTACDSYRMRCSGHHFIYHPFS